jgi:hypothetical protein
MKAGCYAVTNKTHWKKNYNPNYIGSWAFQPGEEKTVTIKEIKYEAVQNQKGSEECTVAYFEEEKPMILNKTNCEMIAKVWGTPYIEDWKGRKIILKVKKISAFGEMVDAVRVSSTRPTDAPILCESCGKPIMATAGRSPKTIAEATKAKYKKVLCLDCAKKEK